MNGKLHLKSQLNLGSSFTILLPVEISSKPIKEVVEKKTRERSSLAGHILIAEDNEINQLLIRMIEDLGLR